MTSTPASSQQARPLEIGDITVIDNSKLKKAVTAAALEADVLGASQAGDALMVKGSLGSKMGPIVKSLARQFSSQGARAAVSAQG